MGAPVLAGCFQDHETNDSFEIAEDLRVRDSQDTQAMPAHPRIADSVTGCRVPVRDAIKLDHQPRRWAVEIRDVRADRHLAAEFQVVRRVVAECGPELAFGRGGFPTQGAGFLELGFGRGWCVLGWHPLPPSPSRKGRGGF
ncbi:MAG: hypothetical protein BGO51_23690 [Rhodospirillales bacterium 69-11]|nr:MAG: hypothetical protein BGO51_23690 [Rhodospirillales bacterium 69-11]